MKVVQWVLLALIAVSLWIAYLTMRSAHGVPDDIRSSIRAPAAADYSEGSPAEYGVVREPGRVPVDEVGAVAPALRLRLVSDSGAPLEGVLVVPAGRGEPHRSRCFLAHEARPVPRDGLQVGPRDVSTWGAVVVYAEFHAPAAVDLTELRAGAGRGERTVTLTRVGKCYVQVVDLAGDPVRGAVAGVGLGPANIEQMGQLEELPWPAPGAQGLHLTTANASGVGRLPYLRLDEAVATVDCYKWGFVKVGHEIVSGPNETCCRITMCRPLLGATRIVGDEVLTYYCKQWPRELRSQPGMAAALAWSRQELMARYPDAMSLAWLGTTPMEDAGPINFKVLLAEKGLVDIPMVLFRSDLFRGPEVVSVADWPPSPDLVEVSVRLTDAEGGDLSPRDLGLFLQSDDSPLRVPMAAEMKLPPGRYSLWSLNQPVVAAAEIREWKITSGPFPVEISFRDVFSRVRVRVVDKASLTELDSFGLTASRDGRASLSRLFNGGAKLEENRLFCLPAGTWEFVVRHGRDGLTRFSTRIEPSPEVVDVVIEV